MWSEKIRQFRISKNLSLEDLAERIGVEVSTAWRWENGKNSPQPSHIKALLKLFDLKDRSDLEFPSLMQLAREGQKRTPASIVRDAQFEAPVALLHKSPLTLKLYVQWESGQQRPPQEWLPVLSKVFNESVTKLIDTSNDEITDDHSMQSIESYLEMLIQEHGTLCLPIGAVEQRLSLESIFQPLKLYRSSDRQAFFSLSR